MVELQVIRVFGPRGLPFVAGTPVAGVVAPAGATFPAGSLRHAWRVDLRDRCADALIRTCELLVCIWGAGIVAAAALAITDPIP